MDNDEAMFILAVGCILLGVTEDDVRASDRMASMVFGAATGAVRMRELLVEKGLLSDSLSPAQIFLDAEIPNSAYGLAEFGED